MIGIVAASGLLFWTGNRRCAHDCVSLSSDLLFKLCGPEYLGPVDNVVGYFTECPIFASDEAFSSWYFTTPTLK